MCIAVIPARGGSQRILQKNIKRFNGKPIIAYSILAALQSNCFDRVIVSTDDPEIAKVAKEYGADVPFIRPNDLSGDIVGTAPVVKHAIEWLELHGNRSKYVCCLYATAPFIRPKVLSDAFKQLKETDADYCFGVTTFPFPIQRSIKITEKNMVEMFNPDFLNTRSQDLEEAYHDAGQFYWGKCSAFKKVLPIFSHHASPFILPRHLVQDIDTTEDWVRAELMHSILQNIETKA